MQFLMTAYNLLEKKAGYLDTGTWAYNAIKEANNFWKNRSSGQFKK